MFYGFFFKITFWFYLRQQEKENLIHSIHEYSLKIYHKPGTVEVLGVPSDKDKVMVLEEHSPVVRQTNQATK
jgi:hypothetical protein